MVSSDKGLAGSYNMNVLRNTLEYFDTLILRWIIFVFGKKDVTCFEKKNQGYPDFSELADPVSFMDISSISRMVVDEFLSARYDQVYLSFTRFESMTKQIPEIQKLLPLKVAHENQAEGKKYSAICIYLRAGTTRNFR